MRIYQYVCAFVCMCVYLTNCLIIWALVLLCDSASDLRHAWPALILTRTHKARSGSHDSQTLAHTYTHTHTRRHVCVWCDAGCCGDQWEIMLGPLTEAIKREWIMRLFIDWSICNQGILLRRSWELFSFQSALLLSSPFPSLFLYLPVTRKWNWSLFSIYSHLCSS